MKKNYIFKTFLLLIPFTAFVLMSSSGGRDDGRTGSPGDGSDCTACHGGGNFGATASITTNIPSGGYDVNTDYTITVAASSTAASGHGFQLTAERLSDNVKIGSFTAGTGSRVTGQRITHSGTGNSSWTFTWHSPANQEGNIKFYAAVNNVNLNGDITGDQVVITSTASIGVLGVDEANRLEFSMFPNPSTNIVNIQLPTGVTKGTVQLFDYTGKLLITQEVTDVYQTINVKNLSKGIYLLKIAADGKLGAQQFVKE